jgi:hypothetical protein
VPVEGDPASPELTAKSAKDFVKAASALRYWDRPVAG